MSEGIFSLNKQEKLKLETWGLPSSILKKYAEKGVVNMFPWQVECLCSQGVLSGGNLVYSAPTSAGKTLVAEILAIKTILERRKKVFFILPFVSVVREKMLYFKELLGSCGVHVHGFMGSHVPPGGFKTTNLAVCTIEKANGLVNRLVEEHEMEEVGCVIVDELHLLGDPHRGYLLELLLAKIKFVSSREAGVRVQIIGMSATLPNLNIIAGWLDAALYCTDFRPVPLTEYLKVESSIYKAVDLNSISMKLPDYNIKDDPGDIIKLCIETLLNGHSMLVFCPTKNWCESLSQQIATEIRRIGCGSSDLGLQLRQQLNSNSIYDLLEQLKRCPVGLEASIGKCVSFGVAYHHAGLTMDERDILENSFRQSVLRVLVATSTLSSGVNLPARRVIVRSPLFGGQPIDILSYKQMIGRAGRMGKDTAGESFLVCKASERRVGESLVNAQLPPVESCLGLGSLSSSLKRAILEVIASGVVSSLSDVEAYTSCTLFAVSRKTGDLSDLSEPIAACIEFLQTNQFIRVLKDDQISPTNLGEACLSAALPPDQALRLLSELHKARQCFVLDSELHVIYQVTPFSVSEQWRQLDWMSALNLWENLSPNMQRVGELVGVEERFLVRAIRGNINTNSSSQMEKLSIFRRFYTALALQDLVNEMPLVSVAEKYKCSKGMLQSLQQSASTFAGMVTQFCRRLGWSSMELIVSQFVDRLQFGVQRELIDLLRIDCLSAIQARALFNSNIQTLTQLATSRVENIEKALRKAVPFESEKESCDGHAGKRKCVWLAGRANLTEREAANLIINEARNFIQMELGLKSVDWMNNSVLISEKDNSEVLASSSKKSCGTSDRNQLSLVSSLSSISGVKNDECNTVDLEIKSYILDSPIIENESNQCVKGMPEVIILNNCENLSQIKKNENSNLNPPLHENNLVITAPSKVIIDNRESIPLGNISKTRSTNEMSKYQRSSLDMFEESEAEDSSSSGEDDNTKFKDIICSLSLYENKVSKIYNDDDDPFDENDSSEEISFTNDEPDNQKKITDSCEELVNCLNDKNQKSIIPVKNDLDFPAKDNLLFDLNTQFDNMLDSMCLRNWDSIIKSNGIENETEKKCPAKDIINKNITGNGETIVESEDESEFLLETPMLKTKSVLDSPSRFNSGINIKLMETSKKDKDEVIKSTVQLNLTNCFTKNEKFPVLKEDIPKKLGVSSTCETPLSKEKLKIVSTSTITSFPKQSPIVTDMKSTKDVEQGKQSKANVELNNMLSYDNTVFDCFKISTPVNSPVVNNNASRGSSIDLFDNSPMNNVNNNSQLNVALTYSSLEDMDINWGGDSILENSMLFLALEGKSQNIKRKISSTEDDFRSSKRIKLCGEHADICESSLQNDYLRIIDVDCNVSKNTFVGKNLSNNYNSIKKISLDKNSEIFITSPLVQKVNGLYESLNIDSQICNVLDNVNMLNNNNIVNNAHKNFVNLRCSITKNGPKQSYGNVHDSFINASTYVVKNDRDQSIVNKTCSGSFKIPLAINSLVANGCSENIRKLLNRDKKNIVRKTDINVSDSSKEPSINCSEFKITDSILETAATFQPVINFEQDSLAPQITSSSTDQINNKKGSREIFPKTDKNWNHQTSVKPAYETDNDIGKINKFPSETIASDTNVKRAETSRNGSNKGLSLLKENLNGVLKDECNDLITSSQEDLPMSIMRAHTRSMLSQHINESSHHNCSSLKQLSTVTTENVCDNQTKLKTLRRHLQKRKVVSVALDVVKKGENLKEGIGARILARKIILSEKEGDFSFGSSAIHGMVIYWGVNRIFYLDMRKSDCACVEIVRELFLRNDIVFVMFDVKSQVKLLHQCCVFTVVNCKGSDPVVADWILSPSDRRKSLRQMLKLTCVKCPLVNDDRNAVREAVETWHLNLYFQNKLKQARLLAAYKDIEMPIQFCLYNMEIVGFGFDKDYAELLWDRVEIKMAELLEIAYQIAGRKFNPRSKADLSKIQKCLSSSISDNCQEFELLTTVMQKWRKLNSLKTRSLSPVLLETGTRLFGDCITTTQTGRVSMHEPNLQNIPKDVIIDEEVFSMRTAFIPSPGYILVSADYCQLELRILAHFSEDKALLEAFNSGSDIFISIAASWHNILESQVTPELRHHTKQICYGLIYGMGVTSLSEQMELSEIEAKEMMESFKAAYPTLQLYLTQCISQCRKTKEVRTLFNRVRFLPDIVNTNSTRRSQAERQAVNTTIQGSAADIAKMGMLKVDSSFQKDCPGAHLVLQLHDELIYEVPDSDFDVAVKIIKKEMENACRLKVSLPVKVKAGPSWGQLEVLNT